MILLSINIFDINNKLSFICPFRGIFIPVSRGAAVCCSHNERIKRYKYNLLQVRRVTRGQQ